MGAADLIPAPARRPVRSLLVLVLLGFSGCGSPTSDGAPASRAHQTTGAGAASDHPQAGDQDRPAVAEPARRDSVAPSNRREAEPAPASQAVTPNDPPAQRTDPPSTPAAERQQRTATEQAQWQAWFAAARDSPDVAVRLQALEAWAQQPGDQLDPVTYALVDEDDSIRTRAQELYQQQLTREAAARPQQEQTEETLAER